MSDEVVGGRGAPEEAPTRSRRRFLTTVGVTGLTVAAAVFGRSTAAHAYRYGCCDLALRPNKTYNQCLNGPGRYTWGCPVGGCQVCSCCENQTWAGDHYIYSASAYQCGYIC
jgi:hypothetical protein